ncbi:TetR/AcrR family transcriptional regulator [Microbacterium sp. RD1]|uniref:TetR/AcrR family transcriptional regulator n=1 Tax=Microbacterium sp. RD1 TaxID=3457313 RepID=UPI003FA5F0B9
MPLPRNGPVRSEAVRQAVLQAAADSLVDRGYDALTIEGIAARAGVGKQTIYRWWPSKGAIIAECLLEGKVLSGRLVLPDTGDIRRDLGEWLRTVFAVLGGEHGEALLRSLVAAAAENADVGRRLRDSLTVSGSVTERLRAAVGTASNLAPETPVEELAEALIGAVIVRALSRVPVRDGDADRLVAAVIGR